MKDLVVTKKQAEEVSQILKSFSHSARLLILCRLSEGPCTVQEIQEACGLEQAPTSQFLARMRREGRVRGERQGTQVIYSLIDERLVELMNTIARLYCQTKGQTKGKKTA
jgi:ArsR family transcriptional regulator, virulence genes transcriptional regulator